MATFGFAGDPYGLRPLIDPMLTVSGSKVLAVF